jgi:hypothetical protein
MTLTQSLGAVVFAWSLFMAVRHRREIPTWLGGAR